MLQAIYRQPLIKLRVDSLISTMIYKEYEIYSILKMSLVNNFLANNLALISILLVAWLLILSFLFFRINFFFKKLTNGISTSDLKTILEEHLKNLGLTSQKVADLEKRCDDIEKVAILHLQKVGLVRFNPFADAGGDQSFTLALLDKTGDGIVISSLHGRDQTRTYAKPVKGGQSIQYEFSNEEKEAIKRAFQQDQDRRINPQGKLKRNDNV